MLLTGFGENWTTDTISRAVDGTLVAGMETSPFGSRIAPLGKGSVTTADSPDSTVLEPIELRAVTLKRILWFTSAAASRYVWPFAPEIVTQLPPAVLHWSQRYEYEIGCLPVHDPGSAVTVEPTSIVPRTPGVEVFTGAPTTTAVGLDAAVREPSAFIAVTRTRIREPTSALVSR